MPKILMIATGGTIASMETPQGLAPAVAPHQLLDSIPHILDFCTVDTIQLLNIDSTNIQPEHWLLIADAIYENYADYDGFVITHGTDTMAYTAAALSYLVQGSDKPIVLTGSQKPIGSRSSDAHRNLSDSFLYCSRRASRDVSLVFDGKVIAGTRARKVKSMSYSAFESINFPAIAYINGRQVSCYHHGAIPANDADQVRFYRALNPNVFLLKLVPGMEPDILEYVAQRYDAILIEGYGMGGLPFADRRNFLDVVQTLAAKGKIIVLSTQVMLEGSDLGVYEVGIRAMSGTPLLQGHDMTNEAITAKLMWILSLTRDYEQVRKLFYKPVNCDLVLPEA
ncbi:asparaginase [Ruminococcaceae bacterium OttesenSCG-928-L11]|nr:asparaginase [Ruminococcaceae bacterium OttesenSCG-928-L11]